MLMTRNQVVREAETKVEVVMKVEAIMKME